MRTEIRYIADDGREFSTESMCLDYESRLALANAATAAFERGATLREAYAIMGREACPAEDVFAHITKDTLLTISHWQCQDKPAYSVLRFDADGRVFVGGYGGWSGWYGGWVWPGDLVRYALGTPELAKAIAACGGEA